MTADQIKALQRRIGTEPDGQWGPKSVAAVRAHLRRLMPSPNPWPLERNVAERFGPHGIPDGYTPPLRKISLPFVVYYEGTPMNTLSVHEKCADSLQRALVRVLDAFPSKAARVAAGMETFDGLYNPRKKRASSSQWSMHSWAIAIDFNADANGNLVRWPQEAVMPIEVMECFAAEGWTAAGAFWGRDAMHFQATSPPA